MNILFVLLALLGLQSAEAGSCKEICPANKPCFIHYVDRVHTTNGWYPCGHGNRAQVHVQYQSSRRRTQTRGRVHFQTSPTHYPPQQSYAVPVDPYHQHGNPVQPQLQEAQIVESEAEILAQEHWDQERRAEVQQAETQRAAAEAQSDQLRGQTQQQQAKIDSLTKQRDAARKKADEQEARADEADELLLEVAEELAAPQSGEE